MPATVARTHRDYTAQRQSRSAPHLGIRALRLALGLTLEQVSDRIAEHFPEMTVSRGTLSAIETGSRGVSDLMLRALERAYGLAEGDLTTDYSPRARDAA